MDPILTPVDAQALAARVRPPIGVVLGTPREVGTLLAALPADPPVCCYQMDLFPAEGIRASGLPCDVVAAPDLWDLPATFSTLLYPLPRGGERQLKIDMIEQAHHVLKPGGKLMVWSPFESDTLAPTQLKKVFGRVHAEALDQGHLFWAVRQQEHARRRHQVAYQVRDPDGPSFRFLSRPGVFSYGRFDDGARALTEAMEIPLGARVVDIGCGCGTNGIIAARRSRSEGFCQFVDSNLRALALAEENAKANGVANFACRATAQVDGLEEGSFDVALANPPYFGQLEIAELFVRRGAALLKPGGQFFLVTKQAESVYPLVEESFPECEADLRRGYVIFVGRKP